MQKTAIHWRQVQRQNFTNREKILDFLEISENDRSLISKKNAFALNVPLRLANKMQKGSIHDPLFRQFVPLEKEHEWKEGFVNDPVCDASFRKEKKLLHKYESRALLVCTSACAMHCRYCFRQNFAYDAKKSLFEEELKLIREDSSIQELILSGGDPLSLDDETLKALFTQINTIPHIKRVRFHSRFPIGIPERLDESFLEILLGLKPQVWFVVHVNHPKELDEEVLASLKKLQRLGVTVLNQSVLLKGVNDDLETLKLLSETLINHGILPYYLHQLDRVQGAAHFEVEVSKGKDLIEQLTACLSGYGVPKYVQEIAGKTSKTSL